MIVLPPDKRKAILAADAGLRAAFNVQHARMVRTLALRLNLSEGMVLAALRQHAQEKEQQG